MVVKVIRAQYDGLREVAKVFAHHADLSVALTFQVEGLVDQLQGGAWRGVGAESFYAEMVELVLPAMRKLEDALQFARDSTLKIIEIMQAAE
ncbi:MAG: WXG100 family type VII secretion target, partial [Anaerolinea sp.]|nr:WXG100 family type VII secretion target [Anaerolinea sp.]